MTEDSSSERTPNNSASISHGDTWRRKVVIVGAGGAGLRAAIAIAEADPSLEIALISKVYPMRSHTCAAEGGACVHPAVERANPELFATTTLAGRPHNTREASLRAASSRT